jgi:2-oxoglutarate dehydrogenase E2 component (dihydrolipoamide succinyltransferase)
MATEVKLPDLGEGIEDVTIVRWRVKEGDPVNEGDVILEVATDKVDTEVAAPASGTLLKILAHDGELVPVRGVMALIGQAGETAAAAPAPAAPPAAPEAVAQPATAASEPPAADGAVATPVARRVAADKGVALEGLTGTGMGGRITKDDVLASADRPAGGTPVAAAAVAPAALPGDLADVAPLSVRRVAAHHNLNLAEVAGDRPISSLTRYDLLKAAGVQSEATFQAPAGFRTADGAQTAVPAAAAPAAAAPSAPAAATAPKPAPAAQPLPGAGDELIKHSRMRAAIARNTSQSLFSAPHVTTMWDVEMSAVLAHRSAHKKEFAAQGVNLTLTAYFVEAILAGLRAVPSANASWSDEGVILKRTYNIGMAVALPPDKNGLGGLIVPVIKNAGDLSLLGLARAVNDLAEKARSNQLSQDDLSGGTFTLTNYGTGGSRFQTPVIVQPQVGILGVGAVEKRAVVISQGHPLEPNTGDYLSFRPMTTLGFSYDHRVLDGATADLFCSVVKQTLEAYK